MTVTLRTVPTATALTTAARALANTGISIPAIFIDLATEEIESYLGRKLAQAAVTEAVSGTDRQRIYLSRTPVKQIDEIREDTAVVVSTDYSLESAEEGRIYRDSGFPHRQPGTTNIVTTRINDRGEEVWAIDYVGGYVLPSQDGSGGDPNYSAPVSGETLLPVGLEFACIDLAIYLNDRKEGQATDAVSERLGDWAATYGTDRGSIPKTIQKRLDSFRRIW